MTLFSFVFVFNTYVRSNLKLMKLSTKAPLVAERWREKECVTFRKNQFLVIPLNVEVSGYEILHGAIKGS